jgi:peptidoglycan/LPS O-acetylase OafA/YrhL
LRRVARPVDVEASAADIAAAPSSLGAGRLGGFDGLRAFAALAVLFHHAAILTAFSRRQVELPLTHVEWPIGKYFVHMDVGVTIFFLISGFLLYLPFVSAAFDEGSPGSTRSYFRRRFLRIFPAYWVALIVITLFIGISMPVRGGRSFFEYFFLVHSYDWTSDGGRLFGGISQAWTLVVEVSFYLFLPLYAWVMRRLGRGMQARDRLRLEAAGLVALVAVSIAWRATMFWVLPKSSSVPKLGVVWLPAFLDLFAMGMALALARAWSERHPTPGRWYDKIGRFGWMWWLLALVAFHIVSLNMGFGTTLETVTGGRAFERQLFYGLTAFFLLLPIVFSHAGKSVRRVVDFAPIAYLGVISYGIYLWHQAFITKIHQWGGWAPKPGQNVLVGFRGSFLVHAFGALALTTIVASLSWFLIERPILRRKNIPLLRSRERTSAPPSQTAGTPAA